MAQRAKTHQLLATAIQQFDLGNVAQANQLCNQFLGQNPDHAQGLCLQGMIARRMGQSPLAVQFITKALEKEPANAGFWNHLGLAMQDLGHRDEAIQLYRQGLVFDANHLDLLTHLASALAASGRGAEAEHCFLQALSAVKNNPGLFINYGNFLISQGRTPEAVEQYQCAIQADARFWLGHFNLGNAAYQAGDYSLAITHFESTIRIHPKHESAYFYLAYAHKMSGNALEELAVYQRLSAVDPQSVLACSRMGIWYENKNQMSEAATQFARVVQLQPDQPLWQVRLAGLFPPVASGNEEIDRVRQQLSETLNCKARFDLATAFDSRCQPPSGLAYQGRNDRELKSRFADWMIESLGIEVKKLAAAPLQNRKIKVGFLVTENHERVFKRVLGGYLQHLNRDQFDLTIICPSKRISGLQGIFTEFSDVHYLGMPNAIEQCVTTLSQADLDVLFFFEVGTDVKNYLLSLFRFAPVQCTSWGYPTTSGSPNMDYYISSALLEPENAQNQYREKLLLMDSLPSYFYAPELPDTFKTRAELSLPEDAKLYVCPQTLLKFHPDFDQILAQILSQDSQGLILLPEGLHSIWTEQLKQRFQQTIPEVMDRIRFLPQLSYSDYLSLLHRSDAMLDPIHFGGGLTTYELLALGIPVVTMPGDSLRGRFTLGCYLKMDFMDCVVESVEAYVALAIKLANDQPYRQSLQRRIQAANSVLFEDRTSVLQLEQVLIQAVENAVSG